MKGILKLQTTFMICVVLLSISFQTIAAESKFELLYGKEALVSRFIRKSDVHLDSIGGFPLPTHWWSRPHG